MKLISQFLLVVCSMSAVSVYAQQDAPGGTLINTKSKSKAAVCTDGCCYSAGNNAPAGIITAHLHAKGKWMVAYMYMNMLMQGNKTGNVKASNEDLYKTYLMSPEKMVMQMHMAMLMYGVTDRLTLMGMGGYESFNMSMRAQVQLSCYPPGSNLMKCTSSGFADTKVYALYSLNKNDKHQLGGSLGLSLPTGSTDITGLTVLGSNERLSYNMQTGTGSFAVLPGLTYWYNGNLLSWGAATTTDIKLDKNNNGYKYGNVYTANLWVSHKFLSFLTGSLRAEGIGAGKITGTDPAIDIPYNLKGDPAANANNTGGKWVNIYTGINLHFNQKVLSRFQLQVEYGLPAYQDLKGTQMAIAGNLIAAINYSF